MSNLSGHIMKLIGDLPDAEGVRLFFERLSTEHPRAARSLMRDMGLLSDTLALAAWSPLLATTLAQNPDYLQWLARERTHTRIRTREELAESLGRFHLTHSQLEPQVQLARFRRRELLRIYLRDIRGLSTLVETTEELSNLADAILEHALSLARQELDNKYGSPRRTDERGRTATATLCVVALGKLGSCELNYASDIDLLFLYSDDGLTTETGTRGKLTNREYFIKLAEMVARVVGQPTGEGAAYRVDLRLRPHGRDGVLASSLDEAVRYYSERAQPWERQALIRSRAAAGDATLYARFNERMRHRVYVAEETVAQALANVRLAKQKIDRHHARDTGGFNVKLGRGGIREIEFIAQALQLSLGGRDEWLREPHTLISLGRLADRRLITEGERTRLSNAYAFLRTLEHRLQMEHGLQTHAVPDEQARRTLVAERMNFTGADALRDFDRALETHSANVRAVYERVFAHSETDERQDDTRTANAGSSAPASSHEMRARRENALSFIEQPVDAETAAIDSAAALFATRLAAEGSEADAALIQRIAQTLRSTAHDSLNSHRALRLVARIASSLDKSNVPVKLTEASLSAIVRLCGASEYFGDMIAGNPSLIPALPVEGHRDTRPRARALFSAAVEAEESFRAELGALRRAWASLLVETGALDAAGAISMREANARQTLMAEASLDAGCLIARRELARRYGELDALPRLAVLGLGRLGGRGMDYGSDLDVVLIYDDEAASPISGLSHAEAYARFAELLVTTLSSLTREGFLYRVDLRLRPDGRNGATVVGASAFTNYLAERAVPWEWLAYVKLRAAAGDLDLGSKVETEARRIIHEAARAGGDPLLRAETRRVRERIEREKTKRRARGGTDIKYGRGGMLDVYFATRYLQLRDSIPDESVDRSTRTTLERLRVASSLSRQDYAAMNEGYALLRTLDHHLRLVIGRSTRLPVADHPALHDIARSIGYSSSAALTNDLTLHMQNIRAAYENITTDSSQQSAVSSQ
jgi:[glutamine synthetase] adenylyltransferase / [glutamine synthetase]-adenylyl-L-tyrosine phosphorylase